MDPLYFVLCILHVKIHLPCCFLFLLYWDFIQLLCNFLHYAKVLINSLSLLSIFYILFYKIFIVFYSFWWLFEFFYIDEVLDAVGCWFIIRLNDWSVTSLQAFDASAICLMAWRLLSDDIHYRRLRDQCLFQNWSKRSLWTDEVGFLFKNLQFSLVDRKLFILDIATPAF